MCSSFLSSVSTPTVQLRPLVGCTPLVVKISLETHFSITIPIPIPISTTITVMMMFVARNILSVTQIWATRRTSLVVRPRGVESRIMTRNSSSSSTTTTTATATATATVGDDVALLSSMEQPGVLTLTMNRPDQRNALNRELLESFHGELERAAQHPQEIRAMVIQSSAASVFSSGHDLKELQHLDQNEQTELFDLCSQVMQQLPALPQPTIAVVNGLATAAGCQLVAACDLVVSHPRSSYSTPGATSIGLFCHTPAVPLVRCIGYKRAMDMLCTGKVVTAPEALAMGLISQLAANPSKAAAKLARTIASQSACAMQLGKQTLYQQASAKDLEEAYALASRAMVDNLQSSDAQNGIEAFLQKQPLPEWKHE